MKAIKSLILIAGIFLCLPIMFIISFFIFCGWVCVDKDLKTSEFLPMFKSSIIETYDDLI